MNAGRERQRQRRHAAEPKEELPSFSEPRKRVRAVLLHYISFIYTSLSIKKLTV